MSEKDKEQEAQMPEIQMTGISEITINKKWAAIIVAVIIVFVGGVGWMYQETAMARPATVHTGGY